MIDEALFILIAGNGGDGLVSFRREKYGSTYITLLAQLIISPGDFGRFTAQAFHVSCQTTYDR